MALNSHFFYRITWLEYCRYGVNPKTINQSISFLLNALPKNICCINHLYLVYVFRKYFALQCIYFFSYPVSIINISYNTERWWSSSNALDSIVVILLLDRYLSRKFLYIPIIYINFNEFSEIPKCDENI